MLPMQSSMMHFVRQQGASKVPKPAVSRANLLARSRLGARVPAPGVLTRAYDDYEDNGRSGRGPRRQGGDQRRQHGRSRSGGDSEDWNQATWLDDGEGVTEEVSINGMTVTSSSGANDAYPARQDFGRPYGRGSGEAGYERRGGYGGGRGYGRGHDRRSGGSFDKPQGGGEGGAESAQQGSQWQGRRDGGWGYGQGQGRRGGGGRGRSFGGEASEGAGVPGQERRNFRGPREALTAEALAARQANNEAVRAASDWRGIAALLDSRGNSLDAENISTMMIKVAREGRPSSPADTAEFETLVASLYGWVSALCPVLRPKQLATCLYAIARLELFNAELVASLASRALQFMGNFNSWEYSNMAWAFARMNYTPGDEWLRQFIYWTEMRLGSFKPMELSNTVGALARLGQVPGPTWLEAFTASVAKQAADFNNLEAVNTLFGLASLGYAGGPDPGSWLGPLLLSGNSAAAAGGAGAAGPSAAAGRTAAAGSSVSSMRVADLTRTTWALTQFDWHPPEWWLEGASRAFVGQLKYCLPSDLATISYSLAYLRARPQPDGLQLLAAYLSRVWPKLTGDELANCAMSLALWQYKPASERWLDELVLACRDKLPSCSPDALSKVVSALPLLGQGYRLNQVVAQAQALLDASAQQQQSGGQVHEGDLGVSSQYTSPDAALAPA